MRNLRSCIKVAVDFVSPDALQPCMEMAQRLREVCLQNRDRCAHEPPDSRFCHDKLQANLIMLTAAMEHYAVLQPDVGTLWRNAYGTVHFKLNTSRHRLLRMSGRSSAMASVEEKRNDLIHVLCYAHGFNSNPSSKDVKDALGISHPMKPATDKETGKPINVPDKTKWRTAHDPHQYLSGKDLVYALPENVILEAYEKVSWVGV